MLVRGATSPTAPLTNSTGAFVIFSNRSIITPGQSRDTIRTMPIEVGLEGVRRVIEPKLTRQEQTLLENAIEM